MIEILDPEQRAEMEGFRFPENRSESKYVSTNKKSEADKPKLTEEEYKKYQTENNPAFVPEEFEFHQARFENKAKKRRGSLWGKVMDIDDPKTAQDFAHEEALRDNADWDQKFHLEKVGGKYEKRLNQEYQEWENMEQSVIEAFKIKLEDPDGKGKDIRPAIFILGGGKKGQLGAGQVAALALMGYHKLRGLKVVGASAGFADAEYFLAGYEQTLLGGSLYSNELNDERFVNFKRLNMVMDVDYAVDQVRSHPKKALDVQAVMDNPTELYAQVTNRETREIEFINAKTAKEGVVEVGLASMALKWVYGKPKKIGDAEFIDGALFDPLAAKEMVDRFKPTHVLVLPQMPFKRAQTGIISKATDSLVIGFAKILPRFGSLPLVEKVLRGSREVRRGLDYMKNNYNVNFGVSWTPDYNLSPVSDDADELKAASLASGIDMLEKFGHPELIPQFTKDFLKYHA